MDKQSGVYNDDVVKRLIEMLCKSSKVIAQQSMNLCSFDSKILIEVKEAW